VGGEINEEKRKKKNQKYGCKGEIRGANGCKNIDPAGKKNGCISIKIIFLTSNGILSSRAAELLIFRRFAQKGEDTEIMEK